MFGHGGRGVDRVVGHGGKERVATAEEAIAYALVPGPTPAPHSRSCSDRPPGSI
jgi:hypothetical protein